MFQHLVTPTFIVVITVIQLHYCHKKFLIISEIPSQPDKDDNQEPLSDSSSLYGGIEDLNVTQTSRRSSKRLRLVEKIKNRTLTRKDVKKAWKLLMKHIQELFEHVWVFLEIHYLKIIMLFAFYLAVQHVRNCIFLIKNLNY